jgi:hypothetical protein
MKLRILKLITLVLTLAAALIVLTNHSEARVTPATTTPEPTQGKTEGPAFKNVKVLLNMSEGQLDQVMGYFGASLGVKCNFCHASKDGKLVFELDDKPEKNTAREMIKMTMALNKDTSKGTTTTISCYTCHRGRNTPVGVPALPVPTPAPRPERPPQGSTPAQTPAPTADQVFDKYLNAIGGTTALANLKTRTMKGSAAGGEGRSMTLEVDRSGSDKLYVSFTTPEGTMEQGFNGTVGWEKNPGGTRQISSDELADVQMHVNSLLFDVAAFKQQFTRIGPSRKDKLDGHDVYVLRAGTPDGKRAQLFFDADTGLLRREVTAVTTVVGVIPTQVDFDDYRDVDGVKVPFTVAFSSANVNNPTTAIKFTEIKFNAPVDDSRFNMPPAPKPAGP